MVKRIITLIIPFLVFTSSFSQEKDWRLNGAASFAPGLITENTRTIQLQGYLGFLKNKVEVRGDLFYFIDSFGDRPRFDMNHQLYFGAFYHFTETNFQPYLGFQPGIALTRSSEYSTLDINSGEQEFKKTVNPVGSVAGGLEYYGEKWFFMFFETRYIFGKHKTNSYPVYLDELRFSFGLGFTF